MGLRIFNQCCRVLGLVVLLSFMVWTCLRADAHTPVSLPHVVSQTMALYFSRPEVTADDLNQLARHLETGTPATGSGAGVFVTLSSQGKTRACWGSLFPQHGSLIKATIYATWGALTKDYRYPLIRKSEWQRLKPQVTVVQRVTPVRHIQQINALREGLMVRSNAKTGIILPGEAVDASYQLVLAKLKAGIQPAERYQLYRITADVYQ